MGDRFCEYRVLHQNRNSEYINRNRDKRRNGYGQRWKCLYDRYRSGSFDRIQLWDLINSLVCESYKQ